VLSFKRLVIKLVIQKAAKENEIEIIPLIQTFDHLEWILKLDKFKSYRDHPNLLLALVRFLRVQPDPQR
jgi:hypothetical protein